MAEVRLTLDPETRYAYIYLADIRPGGVAKSVTLDHHPEADETAALHSLVLDFDGEGRLLGIEVWGPAERVLPEALLEQAEPPGP